MSFLNLLKHHIQHKPIDFFVINVLALGAVVGLASLTFSSEHKTVNHH
jgi:hypothetical protein